ncbi:SDR family NAD(P)-dependent oxidoreductase [Mucilaginibacter terrae]|uniref:SDR family NAD(P)-dependent oxidoreductase n=1 Tax=Mucilaginibacter terrae TaxID=1955052 RepID=UPI00363E43FB
MERLKNKIALITGGNAGIGKAVARAYINEGAKVAISGRSARDSDRVNALIDELGEDVLYVQADVSVEEDVKNLIEAVIKRFGRLDIAINNAGVASESKPFIEHTTEDYDKVLGINLKGVFLSMKYEIIAMLKTGGGSIINTASVGGVIANPGIAPYIASKHGVVGLTKIGALDYAKQGIRVNAVAPGGTESEMLTEWLPGELIKQIAETHPIGRTAKPEEQAGIYVFLGSDESSFMTGSIILNDGGYTAK